VDQNAQNLREDLYKVIQHYADLAALAKKGEVNPIGQIGKIVKKTAPYLLMVINDFMPSLEADKITYFEALYYLLRSAREFPDIQTLQDSKNELQKLEERGRIFIYAVKWLDLQSYLRPTPGEIDQMSHKLFQFNDKYRKRYLPAETDTATLIPCFFKKEEAESKEVTTSRMADLVRRAILELHHLMVEYEPAKAFFIFSRNSRKEIEEDLMSLAWFLFRCGYNVDRIASGFYKEHISQFLNEKLLDILIHTGTKVDNLQVISTHLFTLSLMDFANFFELSADFIDLDDTKEVSRRVKAIKTKNRRGHSLLSKMSELYNMYGATPNGRIPLGFMLYRYYSSFGAYFGDHRLNDPRADQAVKLYKTALDKSQIEKKASQDLEKSNMGYSSKTREEISELLKLIIDSLANPTNVKGKKVKVLGDISSGAMGKVSVGIFRNQIVAIKRVKSQIASALGEPVALLEYESAMHARVQTPEQNPCVAEYFGLIDQDGEKLLLNGYYPNDNLTQLVEKNWPEKYKPPFSVESKINLTTLEVIVNQLLACLRVFRDKGVVHRDLKTDNILYMVDEKDMLNRIKVIDFGVALATGSGSVEDIFKGKVVGTFAYMAPEQAKGRSEFQSDLYSVGAIFTVLLTGKLPLIFPRTKTRQEIVQQIMRIETQARPKLTDLNPWLTRNTTFEQIAAIVENMLDLDPKRRPNTDEVQSAFDGVFQHIGDEKHQLSVFYHKG
jgi:hypothetical protein